MTFTLSHSVNQFSFDSGTWPIERKQRETCTQVTHKALRKRQMQHYCWKDDYANYSVNPSVCLTVRLTRMIL